MTSMPSGNIDVTCWGGAKDWNILLCHDNLPLFSLAELITTVG